MIEDELIMEMNMKAYNDLLLSMDDSQHDGRKTFNIVRACKTSDYPRVNAKLAWDKLKEKYEPTNMSSVVAVKQEFNARTLKNKEDPTEWLLELGELRDRLADMNNHMSDKDFMIHVIGNLPKEYRLERKDFERKLKSNRLTITEIEEELDMVYNDYVKEDSSISNDDSMEKEDKDVALMVGFKGYCNYCGKYGHKKMFCEEAKKNGDTQQSQGGNQRQRRGFNGTCNYCGKLGHKAYQCWNNPNNPNNKRKGNDGQSTRDEETEEIADVVFTATEVVVVTLIQC